MAANDFNLDKQEYQSVFKVFDRDNSGEINIGQVYELINKFDEAQRYADGGGSGTADVSMNIGGMNQNNNMGGLNLNNAGKSTGKNNTTNAGGSKSPTKKPSEQGRGLGGGLQVKPTVLEGANGKSPRMLNDKINSSTQQQKDSQWSQPTQMLSDEINFGNAPLIKDQLEDKKCGDQQSQPTFPNGKTTLKFDEFINIVKDSCMDREQAENYLVYAFSMFDRKKKGFINTEDLKDVFNLLGENVSDDEVNTMIKIAGVKSNDKINFKEFVDFFYKID